MQAVLVKKEQITPSVTTFWFKPATQLDYVAGQFVELTLPHENADKRGERRWFTLSSSPTEPLLGITTKYSPKPSTYMQTLFGLQPGRTVAVSAAMGDFVLPRDITIPLIFVIGGIGVTPIRSMLTWLTDNAQTRTIAALYAYSSAEEAAFKDIVEMNAQPTECFTPPNERLTTAHILETMNKYEKPLTYISGPEELVEVFVAELREAGIKDSRVVTDYFPGYEEL